MELKGKTILNKSLKIKKKRREGMGVEFIQGLCKPDIGFVAPKACRIDFSRCYNGITKIVESL
jgi:hypothetical protein